ncbi:MAG TPA: YtxH domain-containing protein [Actinomycetota bacterium]|jgi:hypothetical protein|nr:YtxH domain-containing protein [Actinomycetota bacterium]
MRGRLGVLIGFGAGYVLGAKAGRERYDQLRRLYDNLMASPGFQEASEKAREAVEQGLEQAKDLASDGIQKVRERRGGDEPPGGLSVAPPPGP